MTTRFDRDTDVKPLGDGTFEGRIDGGWWIVRGPNGGYLAAILLRALAASVGDDSRAPRSLTVHFLRPPAEGPVRIETRLERVGRTLTTASARMLQEGRLQALAVGAFAMPRPAPELHHAVMPEVEPPERLPLLPPMAPAAALDASGPPVLSMRERYEERWALGAPPGTPGASRALAGGWIRLREPRALDAPLVAALTDAWPPAIFSCAELGTIAGGVPTIDLTVHFRTRLPLPGAGPHEWALVAFQTREAREGFIEEDGEIWSPGGVLLAQSRQLAVVG